MWPQPPGRTALWASRTARARAVRQESTRHLTPSSFRGRAPSRPGRRHAHCHCARPPGTTAPARTGQERVPRGGSPTGPRVPGPPEPGAGPALTSGAGPARRAPAPTSPAAPPEPPPAARLLPPPPRRAPPRCQRGYAQGGERAAASAEICTHRSATSAAGSLWRNRLARSAVNRKVGGSSPPRDDRACFPVRGFILKLQLRDF